VSELIFQRPSANMRSVTDRTREQVEQLRRSIAMLQPGSLAMTREDAMRLLTELGDVQARLDRLRRGLRALLNEGA
jgi:hypothetical protein